MGRGGEAPKTGAGVHCLGNRHNPVENDQKKTKVCNDGTKNQESDWIGGIYPTIHFCHMGDCVGVFKNSKNVQLLLLVPDPLAGRSAAGSRDPEMGT